MDELVLLDVVDLEVVHMCSAEGKRAILGLELFWLESFGLRPTFVLVLLTVCNRLDTEEGLDLLGFNWKPVLKESEPGVVLVNLVLRVTVMELTPELPSIYFVEFDAFDMVIDFLQSFVLILYQGVAYLVVSLE